MNDRNENAIRLFRSNYNCAQSVFSAFAADVHLDAERARAAASGFGAGMGALQKTCGAVTGGIMVLGAKFFQEQDVSNAKLFVYKNVRALVERFETKFGTVECFPLLGMDITTEEGLRLARERMLFRQKCERYVLEVCEIVDGLLSDPR